MIIANKLFRVLGVIAALSSLMVIVLGKRYPAAGFSFLVVDVLLIAVLWVLDRAMKEYEKALERERLMSDIVKNAIVYYFDEFLTVRGSSMSRQAFFDSITQSALRQAWNQFGDEATRRGISYGEIAEVVESWFRFLPAKTAIANYLEAQLNTSAIHR